MFLGEDCMLDNNTNYTINDNINNLYIAKKYYSDHLVWIEILQYKI